MYIGGIELGIYHGWGILITNKNTYEGNFSLGQKMGKGYIKFTNNSIYVGDFANDKPDGHGMMVFED